MIMLFTGKNVLSDVGELQYPDAYHRGVKSAPLEERPTWITVVQTAEKEKSRVRGNEG